jgi:putative NADH-flavin reductase
VNVLVFGAAGKTGNLIVEKAVAAGHTVTAFVRDASRYTAPIGVRSVSGNATDPTAVFRAMNGQDAVIDVVGGKTPWRKTNLEQTVAHAIVVAAQQHNMRRIIATSAIGVGDSIKQSPLLFRLIILPTILRGSTADKAAMEQEIKRANVPYILVRPAVLNDKPASGSAHVLAATEKGQQLARADLAAFIVEQLITDTYMNQTVTIANR